MKKILIILLAALFFTACQHKQYQLGYSNDNEIWGLASPFIVEPGNNEVLLAEYFNDISKIDSITSDFADIQLKKDGKSILIHPITNAPDIYAVTCWIKGIPYSFPAKKSVKEKYLFSFDPKDVVYQNVQIKGSFNGWNPSAGDIDFTNGKWEKMLILNPGKYPYRLLLDGKEVLDPNNPDSVDNNLGGFNSVFTVGNPDAILTPVLYTKKIFNNKFSLGFKNEIAGITGFWENFELPEKFIYQSNSDIVISIPEEANTRQRSFIRIWAWNNDGISNEILIPLEYGKVITKTSLLNRHDHHTSILYNVFVDRFHNANAANDEPVNDPEILPKANHQGGDIEGITQKVEEGYFDELGINTLWISPVVQNPKGAFGLWKEPRSKFSGYHGYWPVSFTKIDYRFGTSDDFKKLVETAHDKNMNVLLDFVANHVHQEHPVYQAHNDWATNLYLPDGSLNTEKWDEYRLTTWFDVFLPTLDLENPQITNMLSDSALFWIREYNLDGFRHDATKHIPLIFWQTLTRKLKDQVMIPQDRDLYQIGETYGNAELIGSYVSSGKLDAQFDFNVYDAAVAVFAGNESFGRLNSTLQESFKIYGEHNLMGYITGNQDRARFISYAGGEIAFDEDAKLAGWTRDIGVGDPVAYNKLKMLTAFIMTIPGVPVIYFGDEIGDPGGNDPDNRRVLRFNNLKEEEQDVKNNVSKLTTLRKSHMALVYGDLEPLLVDESVYAYARSYFDDVVITVFNNSDESKLITVPLNGSGFENYTFMSNFGGLLDQEDNGILNITLEANSFDIITNK